MGVGEREHYAFRRGPCHTAGASSAVAKTQVNHRSPAKRGMRKPATVDDRRKKHNEKRRTKRQHCEKRSETNRPAAEGSAVGGSTLPQEGQSLPEAPMQLVESTTPPDNKLETGKKTAFTPTTTVPYENDLKILNINLIISFIHKKN